MQNQSHPEDDIHLCLCLGLHLIGTLNRPQWTCSNPLYHSWLDWCRFPCLPLRGQLQGSENKFCQFEWSSLLAVCNHKQIKAIFKKLKRIYRYCFVHPVYFDSILSQSMILILLQRWEYFFVVNLFISEPEKICQALSKDKVKYCQILTLLPQIQLH